MIVNEVTKEQLKTKADKADLANYLPKSGGVLSGNLVIHKPNETAEVGINNGLHNISLATNTNGQAGIYDQTIGKWLLICDSVGNLLIENDKIPLHSGNVGSHALPISGGTITSSQGTVMTLRSTSGNEVVTQYRNSANDNEGSLGFNGINSPIFKKTDGTHCPLLHTGNSKPVAIQSSAPTDTSALWVW